MKGRVVLLIAIAVVLVEGNFAVLGYVPEWRYGGLDWEAVSPHLSHIILFSVEVDDGGNIVALDRFPSPEVYSRARAAATSAGSKLMVCFGGNGRTGGFPTVATDPKIRSKFVSHVSNFLQERGLDGIDLNWEYPADRDQWFGLFDLIVELRSALGPKMTITMAFYPGQEKIMSLPAAQKALQALDYLLAMAYDRTCTGNQRPPCRHSTLAFAKEVIEGVSKSKVPPAKLALGLPFYSRDTFTGEWDTYSNLYSKHSMGPDVDEVGTAYFNGPSMISAKTMLAIESNVGGVMIWESGQDVHPSSSASLHRAISTAIAVSKATKETKKDEL